MYTNVHHTLQCFYSQIDTPQCYIYVFVAVWWVVLSLSGALTTQVHPPFPLKFHAMVTHHDCATCSFNAPIKMHYLLPPYYSIWTQPFLQHLGSHMRPEQISAALFQSWINYLDTGTVSTKCCNSIKAALSQGVPLGLVLAPLYMLHLSGIVHCHTRYCHFHLQMYTFVPKDGAAPGGCL